MNFFGVVYVVLSVFAWIWHAETFYVTNASDFTKLVKKAQAIIDAGNTPLFNLDRYNKKRERKTNNSNQ